jgi:hypothetical protein
MAHPKILVLKALEKYAELVQDDIYKKAFTLNYAKLCSMLAKETLLATKAPYFFKDFKNILLQQIETYVPRHLYENMMEEDRLVIEHSCFAEFAVLVDDNNLAGNRYDYERAQYIK